ncbi:MAG: HAMP domain-containing protein, partial [bacterium]
MNKLKLGPKLIGGFVFVALIAIVIGIVGLNAIKDLGTVKLPSVQSLLVISEAQTAVDGSENLLLNRTLTGDLRAAQYKRFDEKFKAAKEARAVYEPLPQTAEEKVVWDKFVPAWDKWVADHNAYVNLTRSWEAVKSDKSKADSIHKQMVELGTVTLGKSFDEAEALLNKVVEINTTTAEASAVTGKRTMTVAMILGFLIAIALGLFLTTSITKPMTKMVKAADSISLGDVDQNIDHQSGDEIGQLALSFQKMIAYMKGLAGAADSISVGDLTVTVTPKSDADVLSKGLAKVVTTLKSLVHEAGLLSTAAVAGKLDTRGDTTQFEGGYQAIVQGVNETLDAVVGPLNVAAEYVERISNGDIPAKITDTYNGDFNEIKNNLNKCIVAVNTLVADAAMLSKAAVEGKLDTRADATKHGGDFGKIVTGV